MKERKFVEFCIFDDLSLCFFTMLYNIPVIHYTEKCLRNRILNKYKHLHRPSDDELAENKHLISFGRLIQADIIIVFAEYINMEGEQNMLPIRN